MATNGPIASITYTPPAPCLVKLTAEFLSDGSAPDAAFSSNRRCFLSVTQGIVQQDGPTQRLGTSAAQYSMSKEFNLAGGQSATFSLKGAVSGASAQSWYDINFRIETYPFA